MSFVLELALTFDLPGKKYVLYGIIKYHIIIVVKYAVEKGAQKHNSL